MPSDPLCHIQRQYVPQFARFFIVGIAATAVHWGSYIGLNRLFDLDETDAAALNSTYAAGYIISFIGNYIASLKWTFKTKGSVSKGLGFILSHAINAGMHIGLLNLFIRLRLGQGMAMAIGFFAPSLVSAFPVLAKSDTLLPLPIFIIVVPVNFLLVRFFLTRGDEKKLD